MAEAGATKTNSLGRDLNLIDPTTGSHQQIYQFSTNPPVSTITDVLRDPFGRFLIADYSLGNVWLLTPPLPRPELASTITNGGLRLSWPLTGIEYRLEESSNLALSNSWTTSSATVQINTNAIEAQVTFTGASRYFRLKK